MSRVDTDAMQRYERTRDALVARLRAVEETLRGAQDEPGAQSVRLTRKRLQRGKFVLAVVGEFSSGKSFLLNALLGKFRYEDVGGSRQVVGLLATDINPSTATITELEYGETSEAHAVFEDGRSERIPLDRLNRFIAVGSGGEAGTLHDATKDERDAPTRVVVSTDSPFLERGFVVADTPGLASINPAHRRATLQFLPSADAVLYLIDTQQPFTEGDASFLGIVRQHIDSIFIVQTKIDLWQQPQADGRPAWEHACDRISTLAAIHAPGTYVYALSAREYVEGELTHDEARVDESRFPRFLSALDASLIKVTGRARLRRARDQADAAIADTDAFLARDLEMLALGDETLRERRASLLPALQQLDERALTEREHLLAEGLGARRALDERSRDLAEDLERALSQAFDTADVARLRDRARLHIIVDRVVAHVVDEFACRAADSVVSDIERAVERITELVPMRYSINDAAATAFGHEPGTSLWSGNVRAAIAATIVLDAIGGPAIGLVHDISTRFATRQTGQYMKRELAADLRAEIFPRLATQVQAFGGSMGAHLQRLYDDLAQAIARAVVSKRDADIGSVDRALRSHEAGEGASRASHLEAQRVALGEHAREIDIVVNDFMQREEEIAPADPGPANVRIAHAGASAFDPSAYDRGLRPQRWRVAVLGALRRGKTSLINAFAGRDVLKDDVAASARFPIHVRYAEREAAYALSEQGEWKEIPFEHATDSAATSPVLILVPWDLPRELVLVHAPAFDSGEPNAEDVNVVVASHASEVLALFSRQLSDRELALYERVAEFNKPMLFAHTIADNEAPNERRHVIELAKQYLHERNIPAERVFVVSAHDYDEAKREQRAAAAWNETDALRSTLEAHAQEHMSRLDRLARAAKEQATQAAEEAAAPAPTRSERGLFARLFGKGR